MLCGVACSAVAAGRSQEREVQARRLEEERRRRAEAERRLQDEAAHRRRLVDEEVKMREKHFCQVSAKETPNITHRALLTYLTTSAWF